MALAFFVLLPCFLMGSALAGTECPPREDIYPCSCANIPIGKRLFHTLITCHRLESTQSLHYILPALRGMQIDQMNIYDSFWDREDQKLQEKEKVMPQDWLALKVKELEIMDSSLSSCFACNSQKTCRNIVTTRFTAVNSSSDPKICGLCNTPRGEKYSWVGCMEKLREFHFRQGGLESVGRDLFPTLMKELSLIDLSYNKISKVDGKVFMNTPRLKILNLSHNNLEVLTDWFPIELTELQELHLSSNLLKSFSSSIFPKVPKLKTLQLDNNRLEKLKESEFKNPPVNMIVLNLSDNPIHCDCDIRWINHTFAVKVNIQGYCHGPEGFQQSRLRRASINLNERCDEDGNVGDRKKSTAAALPIITDILIEKKTFV